MNLHMARLTKRHQVIWCVVCLALIAVMNLQPETVTADLAQVAIALKDGLANGLCPPASVVLFRAAAAPIAIAITAVLAAVALSQRRAKNSLEELFTFVFSLAVTGAVSVAIMAPELFGAIQARLDSKSGFAVPQHTVRKDLSGAQSRTCELDLSDRPVGHSAGLADPFRCSLLSELSGQRHRAYSGFSHSIYLKSIWSGLRSASTLFAARSYFPIFTAAVQS